MSMSRLGLIEYWNSFVWFEVLAARSSSGSDPSSEVMTMISSSAPPSLRARAAASVSSRYEHSRYVSRLHSGIMQDITDIHHRGTRSP